MFIEINKDFYLVKEEIEAVFIDTIEGEKAVYNVVLTSKHEERFILGEYDTQSKAKRKLNSFMKKIKVQECKCKTK